MMERLFGLAQPGLFLLDPERAHEVTLRALEAGLHPRAAPADPRLAQRLWGLDFANPLGMAAGFDKDARAPGPLLAMGFGFVEVGTVTPRPQPGNPRPRVFRLHGQRALVNRLGFNSGGAEAALGRLRRIGRLGGVVGVNIGANRDSHDPAGDYVLGLRAFTPVADYIAVNVSSPNTPGLRDLQAAERLDALLGRLAAEREALAAAGQPRPPLLVKLSPDLEDKDLPGVVERLLAHGVDGAILTNTTLSREGVPYAAHRGEAGGLSGRPLFARATRMLARVHLLAGGRLALIGVGGVDSGEAALRKILAGARLVQTYTGMIYAGPGLIGDAHDAMLKEMHKRGLGSIAQLCGLNAEAAAAALL